MTQPTPEDRAAAAFKLWFFRDISDEQRRSLIRLVLGDGVASESDTVKMIAQTIRNLAPPAPR